MTMIALVMILGKNGTGKNGTNRKVGNYGIFSILRSIGWEWWVGGLGIWVLKNVYFSLIRQEKIFMI